MVRRDRRENCQGQVIRIETQKRGNFEALCGLIDFLRFRRDVNAIPGG